MLDRGRSGRRQRISGCQSNSSSFAPSLTSSSLSARCLSSEDSNSALQGGGFCPISDIVFQGFSHTIVSDLFVPFIYTMFSKTQLQAQVKSFAVYSVSVYFSDYLYFTKRRRPLSYVDPYRYNIAKRHTQSLNISICIQTLIK